MHLGQAVKAKNVAKYVFLPGIVPRMQNFARNGFGWLAHMMAIVYYAVRLLPANHPYLRTDNIGRFGVRHVIAEAGRRLVFRKENIDQIIVFVVLLVAFVILVLQFGYLALALIMKPAFAQLFTTAFPERDIAFMLLDSVFGIPDLYDSCVSTGVACSPMSPVLPFPTPFHEGLHALLEFYSLAILLIGCLIFLYYVLIVVGETAQSGTPFGKRFSNIWAPIRLVVALGLLVPVNYGLNSGQYIALFAAKLGSGFATNGWRLYNDGLTNAFGLEDDAQLIARPKNPQIYPIWQFMTIVAACRVSYMALYDIEIQPYLVKNGFPAEVAPPGDAGWTAAVEFYDRGDVIIRFGHEDASYTTEPGNVKPYCGEVTVYTKDLAFDGSMNIQQYYYRQVVLWGEDVIFENFGKRAACLHIDHALIEPIYGNCDDLFWGGSDNAQNLPPAEWRHNEKSWWDAALNVEVAESYTRMTDETDFTVTAEILDRGWGGAGIWYNRIAHWNGALTGAIIATPTPSSVPIVMDEVQSANRANNKDVTARERYDPLLAEGKYDIKFQKDDDKLVARVLNSAYRYWFDGNAAAAVESQDRGNVLISAMSAIFGLDGLFSMRTNHTTHPMAQLSALGKGIMDNAIRNLMHGLAFSYMGGVAEIMGSHAISATLNAASGMLVSVVSISLTIGFILYYILPFLPFIFFFFAVGAWVKTIFEAMVGIPLWALAHLRLDGNGLPGESAGQGYFLIFEIFVRPILTVFGLLASLIIFSGMAKTLNGLFQLATKNLTGFDCIDCELGAGGLNELEKARSMVDEFFLTVMYAILVYMIGVSSFKLIDLIPDNILRWMGAGVKSFGGQFEDPTGSLVQYAAYSGAHMSNEVIGAAKKGAGLAGEATGHLANAAGGIFSRNAKGTSVGK